MWCVTVYLCVLLCICSALLCISGVSLRVRVSRGRAETRPWLKPLRTPIVGTWSTCVAGNTLPCYENCLLPLFVFFHVRSNCDNHFLLLLIVLKKK